MKLKTMWVDTLSETAKEFLKSDVWLALLVVAVLLEVLIVSILGIFKKEWKPPWQLYAANIVVIILIIVMLFHN